MPAQGGSLSDPVQKPLDVAVAGGGIAGLSVAWAAARRGLRVGVFDAREPASGTTHVAAGMLAPVSEAAFGEPEVLELNVAAAAAYEEWTDRIAAASGRDPGLRRCGTLLLARDRDQAEALGHEAAHRRELGLDAQPVTATTARELEPALAPVLRRAIHVPGDHAVDPRALAGALLGALESAGAGVHAGAAVEAVEVRGGRVAGVRMSSGQTIAAENVVLAVGAASTPVTGLPDEALVPVRPVKGQLLRLRDPAGPGLVERVLRTEDAYLVPRGDGAYVLGATMEDRGYDESVTAGAILELLREATELVPGLVELEITEAVAGLRPCTPDNVPAVGPGTVSGLHWATGHFRHGVLQAAVTGEIALAGIEGRAHELAHLCEPRRFADQVAA
jgi:glycine oxidase